MDPAAFEKARREFESKGDDAAGKTTLLTEIKGPDVAALVVWRRAQRAVPHNLPKDRKREDYPLIANATVNRSTTEVLKKLVTHAKRVWHVNFPEEPIWSAHLLEEPEEIARELMDDEGERLEAQMRADYLPFFAFAKLSGLRREQCIALLWRHVNFKEGVIKMPGKGGREEIVRLTQELRAILEPLRGHHRELVFTYVCARSRRARKAGETYARTTKGKTGESFVAEREQAERVKGRRYPLTKEGVKSAWARLREKAGVDDFRFHDYRHNFGTKAARACGGNLKMVQRLMNHRDQKSTWRYVRVAEKELAEATEAVHRAMQGGHAEAAPETEAAHEVPILSPHSKASNAA
jgi:site-specific recombinase XerD